MADDVKAPQAGEEKTQVVNPEGQEPDGEKFTSEYVKQLRAEAADSRRKLRELETKAKTEEDAKLSELDRLKKQVGDLTAASEARTRDLRERTTRYEVRLMAQKLGVVDDDAAFKLLDPSELEFGPDGSISNLDKVMKNLIQKRPFLVGTGASSTSTANPAGSRTGSQFTRSQLQDPKFFQAHREEIMAAYKEGKILDE